MPTNVSITAEELQELLAARDERDTLRSTLRLVTAERDLAEERLLKFVDAANGVRSTANRVQ